MLINGENWKLVPLNVTDEHLKRSDNVYVLGTCDNKVKTIYISNKLHGKMLDKVICHELTHAYAFEFSCSLDIQIEEIIADFISLYGRDIIYTADNILESIFRRYA